MADKKNHASFRDVSGGTETESFSAAQRLTFDVENSKQNRKRGRDLRIVKYQGKGCSKAAKKRKAKSRIKKGNAEIDLVYL